MFWTSFFAGVGFSLGVSAILAAWVTLKAACDYVAGKIAVPQPTIADYHRMSIEQLVERNVIGRRMVDELSRVADACEGE
jgi:hypothetical protein